MGETKSVKVSHDMVKECQYVSSSYQEFLRRAKYAGPRLILIKDSGKKVFDGFLLSSWRLSKNEFFGLREQFFFICLYNHTRILKGSQKNRCFQMADETGFSIGAEDKQVIDNRMQIWFIYKQFIQQEVIYLIRVKLSIMKGYRVKIIFKFKNLRFGAWMRKQCIRQNYKIRKDQYLQNDYQQQCENDENVLVCVKCTQGLCEECFKQFGGQDFEALCPVCQMSSVFRQTQVEICEACADIHESEQEEMECLYKSMNLMKEKMNQLFFVGQQRLKRVELLKQQIQINENEINMIKAQTQII
ncbi:unnamed protein product (macronuclear) [Paramecium tetraurelia]|uniref:TLDc domain-containing protein n=1 Tax=Paramecium tetraurelia TaxID=5888 RepID=A0BWJ3_PARTE|nr:uncharacterized protein GSPATT00032762001 [Paramecium tetraurelia]CAK62910.1 unnamed protein product [Paramecium tetraurelia]|eukprot:XP_001430308.1 hypothetical protein (macronuclear) [Paramecium tetraurelia strain d4-2]